MVTTLLLGRRVKYPIGASGHKLEGLVVLVSHDEATGGNDPWLLIAPDVGGSMDLRKGTDCELLPAEKVGACGVKFHAADCDCNGEGGSR